MKSKVSVLLLLLTGMMGSVSAQVITVEATVQQPAGSVVLPSATSASTHTITSDDQPLYTSSDVLLYLPAPANIAIISINENETVEAVILGPRLAEYQTYNVLPIGLMEFNEGGIITQRLLAIPANPSFQTIKSPSLEQLQFNYPGIIEILSIWFENAYGDRQSEFVGVKDEKTALELIRQ